ncbi:MAG TPA: DUF4290 domain-containing protein [Phnomibacter sp.]|nr:DUF4290 domain-containing protein [Phnomibacter sp.]
MDYNTGRGSLQMREYGRHVQQMVEYLLTLEDKEQRQRNAEAVIEIMSILNPQLKTVEDYKQKLWDHLFVMSGFKLEVDAPYPKPTAEAYHAKPEPLPYPKSKIKYNHLGKNLERLINKAMAETDPEKKSGFAHTIAHYMKLAYSTWHKELVHDDGIRQELDAITHGELTFTNTPFVRHRPAPFRDEDSYGPVKRNKFKQNRNNRNSGGGNGGNNRNSQGGNGGGNNRNNNNGGGNRNKFGANKKNRF